MYLTKRDFPVAVENQSIEIPGSGGVRQSCLTPSEVVLDYLFSDAKTAVEVLERGLRVSNNGPCLGWRDAKSKLNYRWLNYGEVIQRSRNIASGLICSGMKRGQESLVGIYAKNCVEWVLVEHACFNQSVVTVPLYDTLSSEGITFILNQVEAEIVFCDTEKKLRNILNVKSELLRLKKVIVLHSTSEEIKHIAAEKHVILHQLKDIEDLGKRNPQSLMLPCPSDLATICYTSGTTGNPKGVMITHANMVADAGAFLKHLGSDYIGVGDKHISYLPLAHIYERISQIILMMKGASIGFFRGDITQLGEDIRALKPTMLAAVPRVLNKVYDKVQKELNSNKVKKFMLNVAIRAKLAEIERGVIRNNSIWDRLVLKNIRNALGGNVRLLVSAGAPIRDEVLQFFRGSLGCFVLQGYGQTEVTAAITMNVLGEFNAGSVGPPLPCCFLKLIDVPEMNYFACKGEGEIIVKGSTVMKGYFKDPVQTAETLDEDGWVHTGDIGRWVEDGSLAVIDRKKHFMKLSQGEYISPEKVETIYLSSPYVEQIYIHVNPLKSYLVAIVVPEKEALLAWCSLKHVKGEWKGICKNEDVKKHILKHLQELGQAAHLKGFEQVKAIYLHPELFTQENNILTATMKLKRRVCENQFKDILENMYKNLQ